jgi:hypothetical protein
VKQRASSLFRQQRSVCTLRFTCEHCTYFDSEREVCSHGYPNAAHREAHFAADVEVELIFCKDFELL